MAYLHTAPAGLRTSRSGIRLEKHRHIFEQFATFDNMYDGYLLARKHKRYQDCVLEYTNLLEDNLIDAKNNLEHIQTAFDNLTYRQKDAQDGADPVVTQKLADFKQSFTEAMDDDINVQNGITVVYELVKFANVYAQQKVVKAAALTEMKDLISELVSIFGVKLASSDNELNDEHIQALINERNEARKNKDFARSDQIRDELKAQGIILEDTPQGMRFKRVKE